MTVSAMSMVPCTMRAGAKLRTSPQLCQPDTSRRFATAPSRLAPKRGIPAHAPRPQRLFDMRSLLVCLSATETASVRLPAQVASFLSRLPTALLCCCSRRLQCRPSRFRVIEPTRRRHKEPRFRDPESRRGSSEDCAPTPLHCGRNSVTVCPEITLRGRTRRLRSYRTPQLTPDLLDAQGCRMNNASPESAALVPFVPTPE